MREPNIRLFALADISLGEEDGMSRRNDYMFIDQAAKQPLQLSIARINRLRGAGWAARMELLE